MQRSACAQLEAGFFREVNAFVEPWIRAGLGNPICLPIGPLVLETTGRKSKRKLNVPVIATRFGEVLVCATIRHNSQWLKNLVAQPEIRYWLGGRAHNARAYVIDPQLAADSALPAQATWLSPWLQQQYQLWGLRFAVLIPRT